MRTCDALHDLVSFVQFKKREKHPCRRSDTPWVFFTFFKLYKWYQIAQNITYRYTSYVCTIMCTNLDFYLNALQSVTGRFWWHRWSPILFCFEETDWGRSALKKWQKLETLFIAKKGWSFLGTLQFLSTTCIQLFEQNINLQLKLHTYL